MSPYEATMRKRLARAEYLRAIATERIAQAEFLQRQADYLIARIPVGYAYIMPTTEPDGSSIVDVKPE